MLSVLAGPGYDAVLALTTRADTAPPHPDLDMSVEPLPSTVQGLCPSASILRRATDPATGDRYIEDLSFEVVTKQRMSDVSRKAQRLQARGVRRVFAVLVEREQVAEWSTTSGNFIPVADEILDPSLVIPLSVQALLQSNEADCAVARALLAKGNPVLTHAFEEDYRQGRLEGWATGRAESRCAS